MTKFALPCLCGLCAVTLALLGACSGASPEAFPGLKAGSSGSSSGGYGSSSSSGGGSSTGSSGGSSSSSGGHASSSSGGSSSSSSGGDEAGQVGGDDGGADSSSGAGDGSSSQGLICKGGNQSSTCQRSESCCIATGAFTGTTATCQNSNNCTGTTVRCAGTADCPQGQICCGTGTTTGITTTYSQLTCAATCPAGTGFTARYQFCDPAANDCPSSKSCTASTGLVGYSYCR